MQKKFTFRNSEVHYSKTGSGLPVVLLHGFAEDSNIWKGIVQALENSYQLLLPDLPGSGKSPIINQPTAGLEIFAEMVNALLIEEGIDQCVLIGHSMGGYITLAFAEKYPEKLRAFGLFHSSAFADDEEKVETRKKAIKSITENGPMAFLKTSIPGLFRDPESSDADIAELLNSGKNFTGEALIQYYEAMINRPDRTKVLQDAKVPVLMILGEHDKAVPFESGLRQTNLATQTHVHIFRQSAHMGMLEEAEKARKVLGEFLDTVSGN